MEKVTTDGFCVLCHKAAFALVAHFLSNTHWGHHREPCHRVLILSLAIRRMVWLALDTSQQEMERDWN